MTTQPHHFDLSGVLISTLCLYERKDEALFMELETYLKILYQNRVIQLLRSVEVEDYTHSRKSPLKEAEQTDLMLLLVTPHFLSADFCYSAEMRQLIEAHNLKKICIIPLVFTECDLERTPLKRLLRLPCNDLPLVNEYTQHFEKPLLLMSRELEDRIQRLRYAKHQVEEAWKTAGLVDEYHTYRSFLKTYPYSRYAPYAKKRSEELVEAKLWKEAHTFNTIEHLLNYLREAPLQEHEEEAIDKIIEIEDSIEIAGQEALEIKEPVLLFDYVARFPGGNEVWQVQDEISQQMSDPFFEVRKEQPPLETEAHKLFLQASTQLEPKEILELDRYSRFGENLLRLAMGNIKHINNQVFTLGMMLFMMTTLGMMLALLMKRLSLSLGNGKYVLWVVLIWLAYRLVLAAKYFYDDLNYCKKTREQLRRSLVRLKVGFLLHDKRSISKILMSFMTANTRLLDIKGLSFLNYLRPRSKQKERKKKGQSGKKLPPEKEEEKDKKGKGGNPLKVKEHYDKD